MEFQFPLKSRYPLGQTVNFIKDVSYTLGFVRLSDKPAPKKVKNMVDLKISLLTKTGSLGHHLVKCSFEAAKKLLLDASSHDPVATPPTIWM